MADGAVMVWEKSPVILANNIGRFPQMVHDRIGKMLMEEKLESTAWMKRNRPWNDITGNARRGLRVHVEEAGTGWIFSLIHSVEYGIYLEVRHGGRFATIVPALRRAVPRIRRRLKGIAN